MAAAETDHFDLAVIGAGIVGLAHALAAARHGKRVVVIDRDAAANGASIRNFGFITVTGQQAGRCWGRALRSRDVWAEVRRPAGIAVEHEGLCMAVRRPEALRCSKLSPRRPMGARLPASRAGRGRREVPTLRLGEMCGALWSPHELRVESAQRDPGLAAWLAGAHGVTFLRPTLVQAVSPPIIATTRGTPCRAECAVVCPGRRFPGAVSGADRGLWANHLQAAYDARGRRTAPCAWGPPSCPISA